MKQKDEKCVGGHRRVVLVIVKQWNCSLPEVPFLNPIGQERPAANSWLRACSESGIHLLSIRDPLKQGNILKTASQPT